MTVPESAAMRPHMRVVQALLRTAFRIVGRCRVHGLEHVPPHGPLLLCANHVSYFDPPFVFAFFPPIRIYLFGARKYRSHWFFGPILGLGDVIWITQGGADREALRAGEIALRDGHILAMSPEGTRSGVPGLIPARAGVAYLATDLGVPILPCAIVGTDLIKTRLPRLRRSDLSVTFGPPFCLAPISGRGRSTQLADRTDVVMARIACMLPESYRGVYAGHPYVQRLERGEGPLPGELPAPATR